MNGYLRQSTASQSRLIGPFVSDTDFKTAQTALTIANTDIKLRANGTTLSNKNSGGGTHQVNGSYSVTWDATDTANVGELFFIVSVSGALLVWGLYTVLEEAVYDEMFAASALGYIVDQPVNATKIGGTTQTGRDIGANVLLAADQAVNTTKLGGTTVTGRDIGASVLLSSGTGTGQIDFTSGVVKANLSQILGTALTETAGQIAAAFKKFFDKASPTGTVNSLPDAVPDASGGLPVTGTRLTAIPTLPAALVSGRIDASIGAYQSGQAPLQPTTAGRTLDVSAGGEAGVDWANVGNSTSTVGLSGTTVGTTTALTNAPVDSSGITTLLSRLSALRAGYLDNLSAGATALESSLQSLITTVGAAGAGLTATATAVWAVATRLLTAGTNIVLAKGTGVTGFNDLSAAAVNAEVDTALADYDGPTHAELTSELATADDATLTAVGALNNVSIAQIVAGMFTEDSGQTYADSVAGSVVKEIADNAGGSAPTASEIAVAVRNNLLGSRDANILFLEAGGASTQGFELYKELGGTPVVDTTIKPPKAYSSIKCAISEWVRTNCGRSGKISFDFYTESLPSSANEPIILTEDSSGSPDPIIDLRIGPDGLMHWHPVTGAAETAGSQVLTAGAWHKITLCFNDHGTADDLDGKVYVDGTQDISITGQGSNGITAGQFRFTGPTIDGGPFYFANLYVDDNPDLVYPGSIRTTAKFGAAVNADDFDTTGGTGAVNERPLDESNYREQVGSAQARQNYTLQAANEGDTDVSGALIVGVMGWIRAKKSTPIGGAGSPAITIDGRDYAIGVSGSLIGTSPSTIMKVVNQSTYPSNAAGIGMVSGGTSVDYFLYDLGVVIAYIDPIIPTVEAIADAVWNENIVSEHQTEDTAGRKLSQGLVLYDAD